MNEEYLVQLERIHDGECMKRVKRMKRNVYNVWNETVEYENVKWISPHSTSTAGCNEIDPNLQLISLLITGPWMLTDVCCCLSSQCTNVHCTCRVNLREIQFVKRDCWWWLMPDDNSNSLWNKEKYASSCLMSWCGVWRNSKPSRQQVYSFTL